VVRLGVYETVGQVIGADTRALSIDRTAQRLRIEDRGTDPDDEVPFTLDYATNRVIIDR